MDLGGVGEASTTRSSIRLAPKTITVKTATTPTAAAVAIMIRAGDESDAEVEPPGAGSRTEAITIAGVVAAAGQNGKTPLTHAGYLKDCSVV